MEPANIILRTRGGPRTGWWNVLRTAAFEVWLHRHCPNAQITVMAEGDREVHDFLWHRVRDLIALPLGCQLDEEMASAEQRPHPDLVIIDLPEVPGRPRAEAWLRSRARPVIREARGRCSRDGNLIAAFAPEVTDEGRTELRPLQGPEWVLVDPDLRRDRDADEERLQVVLHATPAVAADTVEGWVRHLDVPGARVRVLADTDLAARLRFRIPSSLADVVTDPLVQRESLASASVAVLTSSELWTEAAYLGVPALIVSEDPQVQEDGAAFARLGAAVTLRHVDSARVANATRDLLENMLMRRAMARAGRRLVDGRGLLRIVGSLLPGVSNTVVQA